MSGNSSLDLGLDECLNSTAGFAIGIGINVIKVLLVLPLYIFILYLGLQQWRTQHSFSSASHSDVFTYHTAVFEFIWLIATVFHFWAFTSDQKWVWSSYYLLTISWYGENFFHVLTCVERYLAVVHPIVYMRLRNARGVRVRNISIVSVWVLSVVCSVLVTYYHHPKLPVPFMIPFALCLLPVSFCSLSVLYVLVRPGPGDGGQDRRRVDPAKLRAFLTIAAILVALLFWLGGIFIAYFLFLILDVRNGVKCVVISCAFVFNLPSASVLPLLYLHRAGKLSLCCLKKKTGSERKV